MVVLQLIVMGVMRLMTPVEPKVIYQNVPVYVPQPPPQQQNPVPTQQPAFTQSKQEIVLPEYEPRKPASDGLRLDAGLPDGIQETRPPGT